MKLLLNLSQSIQSQYKKISSKTTSLELAWFDFYPPIDKVQKAVEAIPVQIKSLRMSENTATYGIKKQDHWKQIFNAIPSHIISLNLSENEFFLNFTSSVWDMDLLKSIPYHIISLDLSQNFPCFTTQSSLPMKWFQKLCEKIPKNIVTITFSDNNLPTELTPTTIKALLPHVQNIIITNAEGEAIKNHPCSIGNLEISTTEAMVKPQEIQKEPISSNFFIEVMASGLMFYTSLALAIVGLCMLALGLITSGVAIAGIGVIAFSGSFFAAKQTTSSMQPDHTTKLSPV